MEKQVAETIKHPRGRVRFILRDQVTGKTEVTEYDNLVVDAGLTAVAASTVDPNTSGRITYVEIGTGTNAPAAGDVALQTSYLRKAIASWGAGTKQSTVTAYFTLSEGNTTLREAGLFIGGSLTPASGTLFSRVAINITKTGAQTLTIEWSISWT